MTGLGTLVELMSASMLAWLGEYSLKGPCSGNHQASGRRSLCFPTIPIQYPSGAMGTYDEEVVKDSTVYKITSEEKTFLM